MKTSKTPWPNGLWRMAGTEGTGEYTVRAASVRGRVGVRHLHGGTVRIRLELPTEGPSKSILSKMQEELPRSVGYKQPGDQGENRFSIVVPAGAHADGILALIFRLLGQGKLKGFILNPDMLDPTVTSNPLAA